MSANKVTILDIIKEKLSEKINVAYTSPFRHAPKNAV
jgi:hypothetical protein